MGKAVQKEVARGSASPSCAKTGHVADLGQASGWDSRLRGHQDRDQPPGGGPHGQQWCRSQHGSVKHTWDPPGPCQVPPAQHSNTRDQESGPSQTRGCWAAAEMQPTCPAYVTFGPSPAMTSLAPASHHYSRVQSEHTPEVCSYVGTLGTESTAVTAAPRARCSPRADMEHPGCGASRLPVGLSPCPKQWQRTEFRHGLL